MNEDEIKQLFRQFATPLGSFVALGGRKETAEQLARNLWAALIGGPEVEKEVWKAMADTDSELIDTLQQCYEHEMKPMVTGQQLADLRARYGIPDQEDERGFR